MRHGFHELTLIVIHEIQTLESDVVSGKSIRVSL